MLSIPNDVLADTLAVRWFRPVSLITPSPHPSVFYNPDETERLCRPHHLFEQMVRSSLGRSIELSTIRTSTGSYGFYALPVAHLLELTEWVPHQDLLAAGKLVEVKPDDTETEVVFCSHQWTSFDAPDPTMDQLKVLQSVIRKLMAGKTDVRSNGMLDAVYQYQMRSSGSDWAKALPKMCFWLDYFCMPQPGALIANASDELKAKLDTNNDGIVSQAELADAALEPGERRNSGADHRLL